ncbi:hypothetical protein [Microbacterium dauci]|uniref:Lipoprotein n=1 Tax=Microbacterium dauci TaxID=3048008 RepID=A0ABT6ZEZ1_9MICO|nr:hypothetical protein [Microbacterium sp. LX3-4]MDJ1114725.1 hypothetical protein [Microbacterium sp. LX3-4]
MRSRRAGIGLVVVALALTGCASMGLAPSETGVWELEADPSPSSTSIEVGVSRLECASGVTGELSEPRVTAEDDRIVITTPVADNGSDDGECPGNDVVPLTVDLGEPIGERTLVDGACLSTEAADTELCADAVRWRP